MLLAKSTFSNIDAYHPLPFVGLAKRGVPIMTNALFVMGMGIHPLPIYGKTVGCKIFRQQHRRYDTQRSNFRNRFKSQ